MSQPWMTRASPEVFSAEVLPRLLAAPAELILDALPPLQPQTRFLEVGAGGAAVSRTLVERIAGLGRLVSLDRDPALARALPAGPRRAARAVADHPLPFADGVFDVVVLNLVLGEHDDDARLAEVRRVLKPAGWLLATVALRGSWGVVLDLLERIPALRLAVAAARAALPDEHEVAARIARAGLGVPRVGIEERLVAFAQDGPALFSDRLVAEVLLPRWCGGDLDGEARALVADAASRLLPTGIPVVARTAILVARLA